MAAPWIVVDDVLLHMSAPARVANATHEDVDLPPQPQRALSQALRALSICEISPFPAAAAIVVADLPDIFEGRPQLGFAVI